MTRTTSGSSLSGEQLRIARRVVRDQAVRAVETMGADGAVDIDRLRELFDLSELMVSLGSVDAPQADRWRPDGVSRLDREQTELLITTARWEDDLSRDAAENNWYGHEPGVPEARGKLLERAAEARRLLAALGAEPGNPARLARSA